MTRPARPGGRVLPLLGGLALGVCCALIVKALVWLLPLMMFVGD